MKAIIIDDELRARQSLQILIAEYCSKIEIVAMCENLSEGVKAIHKYKPDLVLLDIEMPGHSGLELLDFFDEKDVHFSIIFTTAYNEYALKAFKLSAIDYLLKPISPDELVNAINRLELKTYNQLKSLKDNIQQDKFGKIAVPVGNNYVVLKIQDIVYIKGEGAYSEIYQKNNQKILVSRNLKSFEEMLYSENNFLRTHKSYIVNFNEILSFTKSDGGWLNLTTGNSIPISSDKVHEISDKLNILKR